MTAAPPLAHVQWPQAYRIIRSIHPPVDLFEDIADPIDWEAIASAESKTNPRLREQIGRLDLVPPARRVGGPGASYLMAPFVHVSRDRPGRFTDGSYGVYSAGDSEEAALYETAHHQGLAMAASDEAPGWTSQFRVLVNSIDLELHDLRAVDACHCPDSYEHSQKFGIGLRDAGSNGVLNRSVRKADGECVSVFWPDVMTIPVQGDHYDYHWDGQKVDRVRNIRAGAIFSLLA